MSIFYRCIQQDLKARDAKFPFATLVETDFGAVVVVVFFLSSQWKGSVWSEMQINLFAIL